MKVFLLAQYDVGNINNWSGTPFFLKESLIGQGVEVDFVRDDSFFNFDGDGDPRRFFVNQAADRRSEELPAAARGCDILIALGSALVFSGMRTDKPKVLYTDATVATVLEYYGIGDDIPAVSKVEILEREAVSMLACDHAVFSSKWAAGRALIEYPSLHGKTSVIPFGANVPGESIPDDIAAVIAGRNTDVCDLLYVGKDAQRKRLDFAYEVCVNLIGMGTDAVLHVVGIDGLPEAPFGGKLRSWGYLDKAKPADMDTYLRLLRQCHFMILPSIAECFGIALVEANAFGMPALAAETGGIPAIIAPGVNGQLFSLNAPAEEYAEYIHDLLAFRARYGELSSTSWKEYKARLSWETSGRSLVKLLSGLTSRLK